MPRQSEAAPDAPQQPAAPGALPATTYYTGTATRPEGYPTVLPFVPHLDCTVNVCREGMHHGPSAQWWGVHNPPALFDKLLRASLADGWVPVEDDETPAIAAQVANLRRAARSRTIVAAIVGNTGLVTISDRPRA
jgi:hypothetical protein